MGNKRKTIYRDDLAQVHIDGYGFHWEQAAPAILTWLQSGGIASGTVVDLGCGGGQWLQRLDRDGYATVGVDVSRSMIRSAKKTSPNSRFICGSFSEVALPRCDAVTSLGEPLNYLNSGPAMRRTLGKVYKSLRPGGMFIFDVRHPANSEVPPAHYVRQATNWFCHSQIEEHGQSIIRTITTFRRESNGMFRRGEEIHRLKVFSRATVVQWLRKIGFRVRVRQCYGDYQLRKRQSVFLCRKPD